MIPIPLFEVESGGLLTTVQDLGRTGYQSDGLPAAGVMDTFAASVANILVGNPRGAALLEITLIGPTLRVLSETRIAVCGADLSAAADGESLTRWKSLTLRPGQQITFGRRRCGARAYLSIAGGIAVPLVFGSRSTCLSASLGGYAGRRLQAGDLLEGFAAAGPNGERGLRAADIPAYPVPTVLRVVRGPHFAAFTDAAWEIFFSSAYTLTPQSNRMGYRLSGLPIERANAADILSEAMPFGGLQAPPNGLPILLMADRQTTGGYPLLGTVISADLPRAAQLAPGDEVRFQAVTLAEAQECALRQERWLRVIEA